MKKVLFLAIFSIVLFSCNSRGSSNTQSVPQKLLHSEALGLSLGNKYSYDELLQVLGKSIYGLVGNNVEEKYGNAPYLAVKTGDFELNYTIIPNSSSGFLFMGVEWDELSFDTTREGALYHIHFYKSFDSLTEGEEGRTNVVKQCQKLYGKADIEKGDGTIDYNWKDGLQFVSIGVAPDTSDYVLILDFIDEELSLQVFNKSVSKEKYKEYN